mgnify:CR=1 FL=1
MHPVAQHVPDGASLIGVPQLNFGSVMHGPTIFFLVVINITDSFTDSFGIVDTLGADEPEVAGWVEGARAILTRLRATPVLDQLEPEQATYNILADGGVQPQTPSGVIVDGNDLLAGLPGLDLGASQGAASDPGLPGWVKPLAAGESRGQSVGVYGPIAATLYPIHHGILRFVGFSVVEPFVAEPVVIEPLVAESATPTVDAQVKASLLTAFLVGRLQRFARSGFRRAPSEHLDESLARIL